MTQTPSILIRSSLAAVISTLLFAATASVMFVGQANAAAQTKAAAPIVAPLA